MLKILTRSLSKLAICVSPCPSISLLLSVFTYQQFTPNDFRKTLSPLLFFSLSLTSTSGFSLSTSLSLTLLLTPTMPPIQPLLRLASFDKRRLGLSNYPETHKSLSPLPPTIFSETHTMLWNLLKAVDGVNQLLVVCLRWSPTVLGMVDWFLFLGFKWMAVGWSFTDLGVDVKMGFDMSMCFIV